jgi:hypothetical protein
MQQRRIGCIDQCLALLVQVLWVAVNMWYIVVVSVVAELSAGPEERIQTILSGRAVRYRDMVDEGIFIHHIATIPAFPDQNGPAISGL